MKQTLLLLAFSLLTLSTFTQNVTKFWETESTDKAIQEKRPYLRSFVAIRLDTATLLNKLQNTPLEGTSAAQSPTVIALPLPDGTTEHFEIVESPIMEPNLAQKYVNFRTFSGRGLKDRTAKIRLSWTAKGLHAHILSSKGTIFINALREDKTKCISFYKKDFSSSPFLCELEAKLSEIATPATTSTFPQTGETLRTMRTAIAANGEYTTFHGGTVEDAMAAIVVALNRLNNLFERELTLRFILVEDNDKIIFTNKDTDPYTNSSTFDMLGENMQTLDSLIGFNNFDIGHVFGISSGGVASFVGNACTSEKAGGVTTLDPPEGYEFVIEYAAHEFGHQLGANHSWSNCRADVENQLNSETAMEPGSGSTIMSYSGLCPDNNVVETSHDNFHAVSLTEINANLDRRLNGCYEELPTNNTPPTIVGFPRDSLYIPINTFFELWAVAEDADGDRLTYAWDQFDLGPQTPLGEPVGNAPSFRATSPNNEALRTMPNFFRLILNQRSTTEVLPAYSRDLTFNLVVRDNHPGTGGVTMRQLAFKATEDAGPFQVLSPNVREDEWHLGEEVEIRWDVAGTDTSLVDCQFVDILLSYRANVNFIDTLALRTPNDGVEVVRVPETQTTNFARLKIQASNNIFFDLSDDYFRIKETVTSTTSVTASEQIQIGPNPVRETLRLFWDTPLAKAATLTIWNVQGQSMLQRTVPTAKRNVQLSVAHLPKGIYFAEWQTEGAVQVVKFIVE